MTLVGFEPTISTGEQPKTYALDRAATEIGSGHFNPGKQIQYPFYRRLGGPHGRSGRVRKISAQPGFDGRTVQPTAKCHIRTLKYLTMSVFCISPNSSFTITLGL